MAKKKSKPKRRSTKRLFKGLIYLLITVVVIGILVYVPFFTLSEIKLTGATYLTKEDIAKITAVFLFIFSTRLIYLSCVVRIDMAAIEQT